MIRILIFLANFFIANLLLVAVASANSVAPLKSYKYCNHHKFNFALIKVYDVYLCNNIKENLKANLIYQDNFSLIINYNMSFKKEDLSRSSIEEMSRYYKLNDELTKNYYNQLMAIFPDVKKGDEIEARFNKKGLVDFYHNDKFVGKISDKNFARSFLDIWLHPKNKYQKMIKDLYEK